MKRKIPNEPGALLNALIEFNETPEGKEAMQELERYFNEEKKGDGIINLKVQFINTYIGDLGVYHKGKIYELPYGLYEKLKNDCKEIE